MRSGFIRVHNSNESSWSLHEACEGSQYIYTFVMYHETWFAFTITPHRPAPGNLGPRNFQNTLNLVLAPAVKKNNAQIGAIYVKAIFKTQYGTMGRNKNTLGVYTLTSLLLQHVVFCLGEGWVDSVRLTYHIAAFRTRTISQLSEFILLHTNSRIAHSLEGRELPIPRLCPPKHQGISPTPRIHYPRTGNIR